MRYGDKRIFEDSNKLDKFIKLRSEGVPFPMLAAHFKCDHSSLVYQWQKYLIENDLSDMNFKDRRERFKNWKLQNPDEYEKLALEEERSFNGNVKKFQEWQKKYNQKQKAKELKRKKFLLELEKRAKQKDKKKTYLQKQLERQYLDVQKRKKIKQEIYQKKVEDITYKYKVERRTLEDIGIEYGVTRERIRQILEKAGVDRNFYTMNYFKICPCKKEFTTKRNNQIYCSRACMVAGMKVHRTPEQLAFIKEKRKADMRKRAIARYATLKNDPAWLKKQYDSNIRWRNSPAGKAYLEKYQQDYKEKYRLRAKARRMLNPEAAREAYRKRYHQEKADPVKREKRNKRQREYYQKRKNNPKYIEWRKNYYLKRKKRNAKNKN